MLGTLPTLLVCLCPCPCCWLARWSTNEGGGGRPCSSRVDERKLLWVDGEVDSESYESCPARAYLESESERACCDEDGGGGLCVARGSEPAGGWLGCVCESVWVLWRMGTVTQSVCAVVEVSWVSGMRRGSLAVWVWCEGVLGKKSDEMGRIHPQSATLPANSLELDQADSLSLSLPLTIHSLVSIH